jgi:hypothetical protein
MAKGHLAMDKDQVSKVVFGHGKVILGDGTMAFGNTTFVVFKIIFHI